MMPASAFETFSPSDRRDDADDHEGTHADREIAERQKIENGFRLCGGYGHDLGSDDGGRDVADRGLCERGMERAFCRPKRRRQDLSQLGRHRAGRIRIGLVHAEDVFVLHREIDIGQRDPEASRFSSKPPERPATDFTRLAFSSSVIRRRITTGLVCTLSATRPSIRAPCPETGQDAHGVDGNNESAAGQHIGNSDSYIGMMPWNVKQI
jgi:hypothetical protein